MDEDAKCGSGCGLEPAGCINCGMDEGSPEESAEQQYMLDNGYLDDCESDDYNYDDWN